MLPLVKIKKNSALSKIYRFIFSFLNIFSIFLCIAFYIMGIVEMRKNSSIDIGEADEYVSESSEYASSEVTEHIPDLSYGDIVKPDIKLSRKLMDARAINNDTIGWLTVPGTGIDYAVLQYTDNKYYMRLDYNQKWKFSGSIFADFRDRGTNRNDLSQNYVIYGHNVNTNHGKIRESDEMFALLLYFKDYEFAKNNQHIYYSTYEDDMVWEIFSVFYTDVDFYYIDVNPQTTEDYQYIIDEARSRSEYNYDVDVTVNDKIITLSTCTYKYDTKEEQRFVVMARLIHDNDISNNYVEINPSPKQPSFVE